MAMWLSIQYLMIKHNIVLLKENVLIFLIKRHRTGRIKKNDTNQQDKFIIN